MRPRRVLSLLGLALALIVLLGLRATPIAAQTPPTTFAVTSVVDAGDSRIGDGRCASFAGECTLRAAIAESNALAGTETITLAPGTYELEIPTINDDLDHTGDYDIRGSVTIVGAGAGTSIVDGGFPPENNAEAVGLDRLFEIHPTAHKVTFKDLTLREGFVDGDGAAIQNWSSGVIRLERVSLVKNLATGAGGAINNADPFDYDWLPTDPIPMPPPGRIEIVNSTLSGNGSGAGGAAVNNASSGVVTITDSVVTDNPGQMIPDPLDPEEMIPAPGVYEPDSSPIVNQAQYGGEGTIRITDSTIADNYSEHDGGGVANLGDGTLVVERSDVTDNTTEATGGGIYTHGGTLTVTDSAVEGNTAADGGGIYSVGASSAIGLRP